MRRGSPRRVKVAAALRKRTTALGVVEVMGGARVGEVCGGGDGHGALANDLCLMRPVGASPGDEGETCELWVPDSKTSFARYVNFVGKSKGIGIEAARSIRELWAEMGVKVKESVEDGLMVERADYWVTRVSMVDMTDAEVKKLQDTVARVKGGDVAKHAAASLAAIKRRRNAKTRGEETKYVNVAGGERYGTIVVGAKEMLERAGLGRFVDTVPGPLIRSTHGKLLTHMPLAVESSYTHVIGALKEAWKISEAMPEVDTELDLEGLETPKWAHHSFRRTADRIARATKAETGATKEDIDEMFGWNQAERAKDMQTHYAGRLERSRRACITMMV